MRLLLACVLVLFSLLVFSQSSKLESLNYLLNNHSQEDTIKVSLLNEISSYYRWLDFFSSQRYADQSLKLARQLNFEKGIAVANCRLAHCYWALGENELAIE